MTRRVLITGIDGFIASHLAEHILKTEEGTRVYGSIRRMADRKNLRRLNDKISYIDMELTDPYSVDNAVRTAMPDAIYHLAAQSFVPTSWTAPASTIETNVVGTVNLLEATRRYCDSAYVQLASSSEAYGMVMAHEIPITEDNPLRPLSPYGVSKAGLDYLGYQYYKSYGMNIVRTRTFNQTGPRRGEMFVDSDFAKQIVQCEMGMRKWVEHGNLDAVRDFTDVRDTVRAYTLLARWGEAGEAYNICSGTGHTMKEVLEALLSMTESYPLIVADGRRMRPSDVPILIGSNKKLKERLASVDREWSPTYGFRESLRDLMQYWREELTFRSASGH